MRMLLIALLAIFALAACSSGGGDSATQETEQAATPPAEDHDTAEVAATPVMTGEIEIAGTLGCGHCNHGVGEGCSAAVQTADGAVYILEDVGAGDDPFEQRFDGKQITVRGTAVERDGVGYVTVATFDL
jgi:hypothetical protein